MNKNFKKILSVALAVVFVLSTMIVSTVFVSAENTAKASIGDTGYATLADAVKAVPKGTTDTPTTIKLLADQTISSLMIGHQYTQNIIVDLNGYTLSGSGIVLTAYRKGSTLTVQNGTVKGNSTSGTLRATYGGELILGDDLTVAGAGGSATLVYVDNGSVKIAAENGVTFTGGKLDIRDSGNANNVISVEAFSKYTTANNDRVYFATLKDAIAGARDGSTITLLNDVKVDETDLVDLDGYHTFFLVENKHLTIDLFGYDVYADASAVTDKFVVGVFSVNNDGFLDITDTNPDDEGTVKGYSGATEEDAYLDPAKGNKDYNYKFYTLLATYGNDDNQIVIDGGNFELDFAGDSLAYTSRNEGIVVHGGTFKLGNLGGIRNGMPWIFNARGQNTRHVVVTGGTFCFDIQHQYYPFEVYVPKEYALEKGEDGMYTIVDAVAYVTEHEWSSAWYTNEIGYATLEEAIAACEGPKTKSKKTSEQEVVVLLKDITLAENTTLTIDKTVVIDLNGHTIYGENTRTATHNFLIDVKGGNLTAYNGTIAMKHTGTNMGWNGAATVIDVTAGGVLNLEKVTVQNLGGTDMNFAVHMNNWGEVTLNADDCVFDATYCGVRVFNSGYDMNNVKITNSKLTGSTRAFWVHNYLGDLNSAQHSDEAIKARLNLDIYGNNNTFEITGEAKSPIRYGFGETVYFNADGAQVVDSAEELQDAINNGSNEIVLGGDIDLSQGIVIG